MIFLGIRVQDVLSESQWKLLKWASAEIS